LYERCRSIVEEIDALRDEASGIRGEPSGTLRINVPITLGKKVIVPALARLSRRYPKILLEVAFSDRFADLVKEGLDAVVRVGQLGDSTLVAKRIGQQTMTVCGSPGYFETHDLPKTPDEITGQRCLVFRMPTSGRLWPWRFQNGRRAIELTPDSYVAMNDGEALVSAAAEGMGLIQVPDYMTTDELRSGRLVEVLAPFRPAPMPISVVYASKRRVTPRLRALIEALGTIQ
ncbi:MAG: substrate binding domain-containing protein, partial [Terriglobales bacterium]